MIFAKLNQLKSLTASEQTLVDYILKNPKFIIQHDPTMISKEAFVSVSTIYRLLNKLDFNGLNDLKIQLAQDLEHQEEFPSQIDINYPVIEEDSHYQVMRKLKSVYTETLNDTLNLNSPEYLALLESALTRAKFIDVYTSSANIFLAQNFQFQMQEIGQQVSVPVDEYIQRLTAANSTFEHLAIVISFGGRGAMVHDILSILNENQTPILLIASEEAVELEGKVNYRLFLSSLENHYHKISSFSTRLSLLYVLDTLYTLLFNKDYQKNKDFKLKNYQKINHSLK
ncbi:MurR/RpiR family transcriptional regulator [Marinilactibacillus piezotolerans]|uniref:MurR/RpiR family transcriptional regulator n=1 Tax=Marinilactibacillus piezotolerans TaxID=258723 RepID=UPI0009AF417E|nr:MurR/RpiR family transcriptional regulator [Marinilactibacillus piezotolerans]